MENISHLREQIDLINLKILELLNQRADLVSKIGIEKLSSGIECYDPVREQQQLKIIIENNNGLFSDSSLIKIFRDIFIASKELQSKNNFSDLKISRKPEIESKSIKIGKNLKIGAGNNLIFAGPCAIESMEQIDEVSSFLSSLGTFILRGGAFKPRTSPYSFQGLGLEGLKILRKCADKYNMYVVSEATSESAFEKVYKYCDCIQIGARNMYNYELLRLAGKCDKPILLKRHFSASIEEFIYSAEYIAKEGNYNIILCERGIRTFEHMTRNTLDISAVPILKELINLPVIVDISHSTGRKDIVKSLAKASLAAGADGLMLEVHPNPSLALSDQEQQLSFKEFEELTKSL